MEPIVYRNGVPCKMIKDGWRVKIWESKDKTLSFNENGILRVFDPSKFRWVAGGHKGTGQREVRITRRLLAVPIDSDCERHSLSTEFDIDVDLDEIERRRLNARKKSGQRAKRNCRHKIKHAGFRHMLTGTYRDNMKDFDKARRDFAAWLRKIRKVVPGFRSVWSFEQQERGAWHWHAAIDTLPRFLRHKGAWKQSYEVCTLLWREVVGDTPYEFCGPLRPGQQWPIEMQSGGTINVDGYTVKRSRKKQHADAKNFSLAKMAQYVAKYLTKHHEKGLEGRQMWGSTEGLTPPQPITLDFPECSLADLISASFEVPPGHRVARHWMNKWQDCWVLDTEPIPV